MPQRMQVQILPLCLGVLLPGRSPLFNQSTAHPTDQTCPSQIACWLCCEEPHVLTILHHAKKVHAEGKEGKRTAPGAREGGDRLVHEARESVGGHAEGNAEGKEGNRDGTWRARGR